MVENVISDTVENLIKGFLVHTKKTSVRLCEKVPLSV